MTQEDFFNMGQVLQATGKQLVFVQEGGYDLKNIPKTCVQIMHGATTAKIAQENMNPNA